MALRDIIEKFPDRRYIMYGGKGGLGKTTFSAATAYWLGQQGPKDLVFFREPPASLSDIFPTAIFDAVVDIVVGGDFEYYIYDLVPLGHALYYLSMASVYDQWIDKITALRTEMEEYAQVASVMKRQKESEEDQILKELQFIKHRINTSSSILTDKLKTAFFFVVTPEEMIILDTKKAAGLFAKFDVPLAG